MASLPLIDPDIPLGQKGQRGAVLLQLKRARALTAKDLAALVPAPGRLGGKDSRCGAVWLRAAICPNGSAGSCRPPGGRAGAFVQPYAPGIPDACAGRVLSL